MKTIAIGQKVSYKGTNAKITELNGKKRCYVELPDGSTKRVNNADLSAPVKAKKTSTEKATKVAARRGRKYQYSVAEPVLKFGTDDKDRETTSCLCGCGSPTKAKSAFAQGHDQRLRGLLRNVDRKNEHALDVWTALDPAHRKAIETYVDAHPQGHWHA